MPTNETLEELLGRLRDDAPVFTTNEENLRRAAVLPVLARLDWNTESVHEVCERFRAGDVEVEYSLKFVNGNKPAVFIRAKKDESVLARTREFLSVMDYARQHRIEMLVCTTGRLWHFYLPCAPGTLEHNTFLKIDINAHGWDPDETARLFRKFLGKENIADGSAVTDAESLLTPKPREKIPEAWKELCGEPDQSLVELLAERVKRMCGKHPDREDVARFLDEASNHIIAKPTRPDLPPQRPPVRPPLARHVDDGGRRMAARVTFKELVHQGLIQHAERVHLWYNGRSFPDEEAEIVVHEGKLKYGGTLYSPSKLAETLLIRHRCISNGPVQGPLYWRINGGKLLHELNEIVRSKRGDRD